MSGVRRSGVLLVDVDDLLGTALAGDPRVELRGDREVRVAVLGAAQAANRPAVAAGLLCKKYWPAFQPTWHV